MIQILNTNLGMSPLDEIGLLFAGKIKIKKQNNSYNCNKYKNKKRC